MVKRALTRRIAAALAPLLLLAAAGILLTRVPAGGRSGLPDPEAMALRGSGRLSSAEIVAFWQRRVADAPEVAAHRVRLAGAQLVLAGDSGDLEGYEEAEKTARDALSMAPGDPSGLMALASARAGQHDFSGALALAERVLVDHPTSADALLAAGDARLELGDYTGSRRSYRRAEAVVGAVPPVLSRLARLEAVVGSLDSARRLAEQALVDAADRDLRRADAAFYWFQLASYDFATGDADTARAHLTTALGIDPENLAARELLGRVRAGLGDIDGAVSVYEALLSDGGAADLHGELAKLYRLQGRHSEAAAQVELGLTVAAETADRFPAERRHLIGFLADHDPAEALRLAELDLAERQDVSAHAWYAWTQLRTGHVDEARAAIEPALVYGTQDARLLYQAGVIFHAAGDHAAAVDLLARSLERNPIFDIEHARRAADLLAELSAAVPARSLAAPGHTSPR